MSIASFHDLIELGFNIEILGSLEGTRRRRGITIHISDSVNFGQGASHGGSTATSRHAWQFQGNFLHIAGIG